MNPEIIRAETTQDFDRIEALAREIWPEHYLSIVGAAQVDYMLDRFQTAEIIQRDVKERSYIYALAYWNGLPVGYLGIRPDEKDIFLSKIYIKKEYRGKGIARRFLEWLILHYGEGRVSVWLTVNKNNTQSIASYLKMGFVTENELTADIGGGFVMDDYKMRKEIEVSEE